MTPRVPYLHASGDEIRNVIVPTESKAMTQLETIIRRLGRLDPYKSISGPYVRLDEAIAIVREELDKEPTPEQIEVVAMALAAHAWEYGYSGSIQEDVGIYVAEHWGRYTGQAKAAIRALRKIGGGE